VRDVAADLPDRIDIDLPLELDDGLARHYDDVREATLEKYPVAGALVATLRRSTGTKPRSLPVRTFRCLRRSSTELSNFYGRHLRPAGKSSSLPCSTGSAT
jgi:hypothetical protein